MGYGFAIPMLDACAARSPHQALYTSDKASAVRAGPEYTELVLACDIERNHV